MNPFDQYVLPYLEENSAGCWVWQRGKTDGYGRLYVNRVAHPAHRYTYQQLVGEVPTGLVLDHLCRLRSCCNPDHLEPITNAENVRRGAGAALAGAANKRKTHCPSGHAYKDVNVLVSQGYRRCRVCALAQSAASKRRKKEVGYGTN